MRGLTDWLGDWLAGRRTQGCLACGRCCELYGGNLKASPADVRRWRQEERPDLLARVGKFHWLWMDPATGRRLPRCPFLRRESPRQGVCTIHATKPQMCRDYPTLAHERRCVRGISFG